MNTLSLLLALVVVASACNKDPEHTQPVPHPPMTYVNLQNKEVRLNEETMADLDGDGSLDVVFLVYNIADPVFQQTKIRFTIAGASRIGFLVKDEGDQSYSPVKSTDDIIRSSNELPYEWWGPSETFLAQKVTGQAQLPYWEGNWKNATHKFFPYLLTKDGKKYCGWIELSFDMQQEKLMLHRSATSTVANVNIKAGR